jgi:[ribosomal protein S5]-alanine N-acetyltransferase
MPNTYQARWAGTGGFEPGEPVTRFQDKCGCASGTTRAEEPELPESLTLQRLTLWPVSRGDAGFLLEHWSDPDVRHYLFDEEPVAADQVSQVIDDSTHNFATAGYGLWLVRDAHSHEAIGTAGLRRLDDQGLELVYSITPRFWGHGYAAEAACGVLDFAICRLGLREVLA